ncbi:MAG: heavy metal translocating P-type ATPase, partial [Bdellovibrionaceae bacterium]|nr:heavy metal translocating P-type ATPase [Pseudobdellovibrionaceae bacterium]
MDLPITLALLGSSALSTWNLILGEGPVYFDSTASFIFLILASRFLLKRLQQIHIGTTSMSTLVGSNFARRENQFGDIEIVPIESLRTGDIIKIKEGESLAADVELLSDRAEFDLSLFSGESFPRAFNRGLQVNAGAKLLSPSARGRVTATGRATALGGLLARLERESFHKLHGIGSSDRAVQVLISVL